MKTKEIEKKDKLWKGLPAVAISQDNYIVFSPYAKKTVSLNEDQLSNLEIVNQLSKEGFFGEPKKGKNDKQTVMLYLTSACPLKCVYCFDAKGQKSRSMDKNVAVGLLKKVLPKNNKKTTIHFFGGEPTLNFQTIKSVVNYVETNNINANFRISTNGVNSRENLEYMVSKDFFFDIACDGPPEIQDKQRPGRKKGLLSSKYLEEMVKLFVERKSRFRTKVIVTKDTVKKMPEIVDYLANLGVNDIRLEPLLIDGRADNMARINNETFTKYFLKSADTAVNLSEKLGRNISVTNWVTKNLFNPRDRFCEYSTGNNVNIKPNGEITKCVRDMHNANSPFNIGSVKKINKEKYNLLKKISVDNMPECNSCFAKYICSGGCANENYKATGSLFKPYQEKCEQTKHLLRNTIIKLHENN